MKNDFRLQYPLWMMGFIVVSGLLAYGLSSPVAKVINERSVVISLDPVGGMFAAGAIII